MNFRRLKRAIPFVAAALLSASYAQAAITGTGGLNPTTDPATWNSSTSAYVGYKGNGTLTIDGGSTLTTSWAGIGNGVTGTATVTGSGSKWTVTDRLYVADMGTGTLNILNGGNVSVSSTINIPGSNPGGVGTANIDGAGSSLTGSSLYVGWDSNKGTLNITNGGTVTSTGLTQVGGLGTINFGSGGTLNTGYLMAGGSNISGAGTINTSGIVTDANITFNASTGGAATSFLMNGVTVNLNQSSSQNLGVGYRGTGTLSITGGVQVASGMGYLGYNAGSTGTVTVDGAGSKWTASGLCVGQSGIGTLNITNGAAVSGGNTYIGQTANSVGTINVNGGTLTANSLYVGNNGSGTLSLANGGTVTATGTTTVGTLGKIDFGNGGTLTTGTLLAGAYQFSGTGTITTSGIVADADLAFNASTGDTNLNFQMNGVNVNLTQSSSKYLGVGYVGTGTMSITSGVQVASYDSYLGYNAGSTGTATIDGTGSKWTARYLYVGNSGAGTLNVTNSGNAAVSSVVVGYNAGSSGTISVDGAGATMANSGGMTVGYDGIGAVTVTNGGNMTSSGATFGYDKTASGTLTVSGTGSKWTNSGDLYVSNNGGTGLLNIANGGSVSSTGNAYLAYSGGSGTVYVNGAGSTWTNGSNVYVGNNSNGVGTLNITNGGAASGATIYLGYNNQASGTVTVDGAGSKLTTTGALYVGYNNGSGKLNITNGGTVAVAGATTLNANGKINFGSNGGTLTTSNLTASSAQITGVGIINTGGIIADGNIVYNAVNPTTTQFKQNDVTINLTQGSSNPLGMGYVGSGSLSISDGVQIASSAGYVGYGAGSTGMATVDGTGSKWSAGGLVVGNNSTATGTLNITNGGAVAVTGTTTVGVLGKINFANGGTLTTGMLNASGAQLTGVGTINTGGIIADGDIVYNASTGAATTQFMENGITVNLTQKNTNSLGAGNAGTGSLTIREGVQISSATSYLGYWAGSIGTGTVDGAGSKWTTTTLNVGCNGKGMLNVTNGGAVVSSSNLNIGNSVGTVAGTLNIANGGAVSVTSTTTLNALGKINFDGGTLTTGMLYAGSSQLSGAGTINTSGMVADGDIAFNAASGTTPKFQVNGVNVNLTQASSKDLGVGYLGSGNLSIADGVNVTSTNGYLGYNAGSTGTATIDGSGSSWVASGSMYVGRNGNGTLNITNGGSGTVSSYVYVGNAPGSIGAINVDGAGALGASYFGPKILYLGSGSGATGTLTVTNGGTVVTGANSYVAGGVGSVGSVIVTGTGSRWTAANAYVGRSGTGSLLVTNGGKVTATGLNVGNDNGAVGTVTVDGTGILSSSGGVGFGYNGKARLLVTNGGTFTSAGVNFGTGSTGTGVAIIDGVGSTWTNNPDRWGASTFNIGQTNAGSGKLSISDGGALSSGVMTIYNNSVLTVDVGKGSSVTLSENFTNNGTLRLVAGAAASNGTYAPVTAAKWDPTSTGAVQALGGIWDNTAHTATVSSAALANDGEAKTIDLATTQRYLFTNSQTGKSVGAAFQAATTSTPLTLTATSISGAELSSLQGLLDPGKSVLSGWDFTAGNYNAGDPVYLSLWAGDKTILTDLTVWHFDGTEWGNYAADDLAYDGKYASFTVNGFSGYAVTGTAPVPVPAAAWLFGSGLMGLVGLRRRMKS